MHFSASIAQLLATVVMTVLRVVIRRHISQPPKKLSASLSETRSAPQIDTHPPVDGDGQQVQFQMPCHKGYAVQELTSGFELDIITLQLQRCRQWRILTYVESPPSQSVAQVNAVQNKPSESLAQKVIGTRIRLSELLQSPWHTDHEIRDHAQKLSDTIADLANFVWKFSDTPGGLLELEGGFSTKREISWNLLVETQGASSDSPCREEIPLFVQRDRIEGQKWKPWEVDDSRIDALLHLWIQQLRTDNVEDGNMLWLLCPQGDYRAPMIADWWIGRESCIVKGQELDEICREYSIVRSCGTAQGRPDMSRIVGCVGTHKDSRNQASPATPKTATGPASRAIIQNTTLISFTTQYLLYTFFCKLVGSITRINPETHIEESTGQGTALLTNKAVTELAHKMQERGLVGVADAYRLIVCALHAGDKLPLASPKEPNAVSVFNIYNDALELGIRVKRKDIFQEAQEIFALEVEWLLAQNRVEEGAILLIKAIQRCKVISLTGENRPGEENWVTGRLGVMMEIVANRFVSVIPKSVPSSSSIDTCANTIPAISELLMANLNRVELSLEDRLEDAICSNEVAVVHTLIKNGAMTSSKLQNHSGAYFLACAAREHHRDMVILLHLHGASLTSAPMWWAVEGGRARGNSEHDCIVIMKLLSELGSNPTIAEPRTGQLPLHAAAKSNFAKVVAWLMTESGYNISVDARDSEGLTALDHAAKEGHGSMVKLLIEVYHADINNGTTTEKKTALHYAAIHGDLLFLEMLCDQAGIDLEARCSEGKSALLYASQKGNYAIVEALASRGADINAVDTLTGRTGLHLAAVEGHAGTIRLLLDKGVTFDDQDGDGKTALHHAAKEARGLVVYILLSKGASCDLRDKSGKTALDYAKHNLEATTQEHGGSIAPHTVCEGIVWVLEHEAEIKAITAAGGSGVQRAAINGDILAVEMLLAIGVDLEERDSSGWTALLYATFYKHERVVQALLDCGANTENHNHDLATPLHIAAMNELERIAQLLLESGAKIDAKAVHDATPLHIAAENGHERVVQLLLKAGAEIDAKLSRSGYIYSTTPLHLAVESGHERIVQLLLEGGAEIDAKGKTGATPLHVAAERGDERVVRLLLKHSAKIDAKEKDGATPLYIAAQNNCGQVVQLLLDAGAEVDAVEKSGGTPLFVSANNGHKQVVQLLLGAGAEVDAKEATGLTPLFVAAKYGSEHVAQLLLEHGAETEVANKDGATPLYIAAQNGHGLVVKLLLDAGAKIDAKEKSGTTPLFIAASNGHEWIVELLQDAGAHARDSYGRTLLHVAMRAQQPNMLTFLIERGIDPSIKDNAGKVAGDYVQDPYDGYGLNPQVLDIWRSLQSRMEEVRVQEQNSNPEGMSEGVAESESAVLG